jgi:hypothetical protein
LLEPVLVSLVLEVKCDIDDSESGRDAVHAQSNLISRPNMRDWRVLSPYAAFPFESHVCSFPLTPATVTNWPRFASSFAQWLARQRPYACRNSGFGLMQASMWRFGLEMIFVYI